MEVTLSSKNQIVVPKKARKALGLAPGDKIRVSTHKDSITLIKAPSVEQELDDILNMSKPVETNAVKRVRRARDEWE